MCWEVKVPPGEIDGMLAEMRKKNGSTLIQVFAAEAAPNPAALELIAAQTLRAAGGGATLAEKPELDLLLRLAGTRQIGEAFERVGYKAKGRRLFLLVASARGADVEGFAGGLAEDKRFLGLPRKQLTKEEMRAVERAALLAVRL